MKANNQTNFAFLQLPRAMEKGASRTLNDLSNIVIVLSIAKLKILHRLAHLIFLIFAIRLMLNFVKINSVLES